jgi:hypothetical protein
LFFNPCGVVLGWSTSWFLRCVGRLCTGDDMDVVAGGWVVVASAGWPAGA